MAGRRWLTARLNAPTPARKSKPPGAGAKKQIPLPVRDLLVQEGGYWLEQVVAGLAKAHHDEVVMNPRLKIGGDVRARSAVTAQSARW